MTINKSPQNTQNTQKNNRVTAPRGPVFSVCSVGPIKKVNLKNTRRKQ